jgi:hypothetical protein
MSEPVTVFHPVPVVRVPHRCRVPRLEFLRLATPVRLTMAAASDLTPLVRLPQGESDLLRVAGAEGVWETLREEDFPEGRRPVPAKRFMEFLGGGVPRNRGSERLLRIAFLRTPLVAVGEPRTPGHAGPTLARGDVAEPAQKDLGRVIADARDGAGARLQAYLDGNVRIVGNRVLRRVEPLLRARRFVDGHGAHTWHVGIGTDRYESDDYRIDPPLLRPDRAAGDLDAWHAMCHGSGTTIQWSPDALALRDAPGAWGNPDADARALASRLPGHLAERLRELDALEPEAAGGLGRAFRDRLADLAFATLTQDIPPGQATEVLAFLSPALTPHGTALDRSEADDLWGLGHHVDGRLLPRLAEEAGLDPGDGTALSALAP